MTCALCFNAPGARCSRCGNGSRARFEALTHRCATCGRANAVNVNARALGVACKACEEGGRE